MIVSKWRDLACIIVRTGSTYSLINIFYRQRRTSLGLLVPSAGQNTVEREERGTGERGGEEEKKKRKKGRKKGRIGKDEKLKVEKETQNGRSGTKNKREGK
jgi:hypothetical protein